MNIKQFNDWLSSEDKQSLIMGILNVTPDSFSDGGQYYKKNTAIEHALEMVKNGADIIDIGGESTRPFADPVSLDEEISRVIPVIEGIRKKSDVCISIDTTKSVVASKALDVGASIINDISAMEIDPLMADVAVKFDCPLIIMHMKGTPKNMQDNPQYESLIPDIKDYLLERIDFAISKGINRKKIIIDAPTSRALLATTDFVVSIDIQTSDFFLIPSITGITLEISSSKLTGFENGLVDSPPISIISAPFLTISKACSIAVFFL